MGVGKSTIGRRLAQRLGLPFADADTEIERAAGMTISDIFARFGEAHFRDGERRVIARLLTGRPLVLATGGGAFINDETRALILKDSLSLWLDRSEEHTSELQSLMRISYAVFCLQKKHTHQQHHTMV